MKKIKSKIKFDIAYDFELMGITSSVKFHKLCWAINKQLNIDLVKQEDYCLEQEGASKGFLHFQYLDGNCVLELFKNKSPDDESANLVPELGHFDYILKLSGCFQTFAFEELQKQLREVSYIEYIAAISIDKLKSKDNFLS